MSIRIGGYAIVIRQTHDCTLPLGTIVTIVSQHPHYHDWYSCSIGDNNIWINNASLSALKEEKNNSNSKKKGGQCPLCGDKQIVTADVFVECEKCGAILSTETGAVIPNVMVMASA